MKHIVKAGRTSYQIPIFCQDSSVATGAGLSGLVFNTSSLTAYYYREGDTGSTAITLVTATLGTWVSGGFKEVDATNMKGMYILSLPDAVLATGAKWVTVEIRGAANLATVALEIQLVAYDPQDNVRLGLTALPNVAAGANGGLPTGNASGQVAVASFAANAINTAAINDGALTAAKFASGAFDAVWSVAARTLTAFGFSVTASAVSDKTGYSLSAGGVQAIWDALTSALTTVGSIGKLIKDNLDAMISSRATPAQVKTQADNALTDYDAPTKAELDAGLATLNNIAVADILAGAIEGTLSLEESLRLILAISVGKVSGGGTTSVTFRDTEDTTDRVVATVDSDGNRTSISLDPS